MGSRENWDVVFWVTSIGTFFYEALPAIAAALSVVWFLIRIGEWARVRLFGKKPDDLTKG